MFCHQCGASIRADASFCSGCGTRIIRPLAQTSAMAPPNDGNSAVPNVELARMPNPGAHTTQTGGSVPRASRPRGVTILAVLAFVTIIPTVSIGIALSGMAASASAESAVPLMRLLMQLFPTACSPNKTPNRTQLAATNNNTLMTPARILRNRLGAVAEDSATVSGSGKTPHVDVGTGSVVPGGLRLWAYGRSVLSDRHDVVVLAGFDDGGRQLVTPTPHDLPFLQALRIIEQHDASRLQIRP
jgi:hypothetical protein